MELLTEYLKKCTQYRITNGTPGTRYEHLQKKQTERNAYCSWNAESNPHVQDNVLYQTLGANSGY